MGSEGGVYGGVSGGGGGDIATSFRKGGGPFSKGLSKQTEIDGLEGFVEEGWVGWDSFHGGRWRVGVMYREKEREREVEDVREV